ncbi:SMP-30/gluconolactonase/LRE family protein [Flexivirga meconopsidis]|uniref:SMP-30/gluconolactonase/LRE family protein n=1 Tax=Flexivirga meconopsidis TaxID=2977121 RepID=UPI00223F34E8|nr:hypothetical protein [Flexivirga meconopsidis]
MNHRIALHRRRIVGAAVAVALAAGGVTAATGVPAAAAAGGVAREAAVPRPASYVITEVAGSNPEGIEVTRTGTMYVTSVATGEVFRGSTRDSQLRSWLPAGSDGRTAATGIHVDRWGRVLVAGAATGHFYVYSPDGELLADRSVPGESFLNDFAFTKDAVYVTDSAKGAVYRASLSRSGIGRLEPFVEAADFTPAPSFLNGIVSTAGGRYLLVVDWLTNITYRVDVRTREVRQVTVAGGQELGGDGALLQGRMLRTVQTDWSTEQTFLRTARFSGDYLTATVVSDSARVGFDVSPTTVARDRARYLWVGSQLNSDLQRPPYRVGVVPTR